MNLCRNTLSVAVVSAALAGLIAAPAYGQRPVEQVGPGVCGRLDEGAKPQDYRTASKEYIDLVERHHFGSGVENLSVGPPHHLGGTISYTLRRFPNHHRALNSMARYALRERSARPPGSQYSVDCWFERAVRFQPDDATVRLTYGIYLFRLGKKDEALRALESAEKLGEAGGNFHYNMGLLYADLGKYDLALDHAHRAYALGFNLPGLKAKLQRAGQWREAEAGQKAVDAAVDQPASAPAADAGATPGEERAPAADAAAAPAPETDSNKN